MQKGQRWQQRQGDQRCQLLLEMLLLLVVLVVVDEGEGLGEELLSESVNFGRSLRRPIC